MQITWLGQAGLFLRTDQLSVLIDPYFSDSVGQIDPKKHRRIPVLPTLFDLRPDILIFTHDHLDHFDPETAKHFLSRQNSITVLAPRSVWEKVRHYGGSHNYVLFDRHTYWSQGTLRFTAVTAAHSDPHAIGVIICDGSRNYYITGDTLYNESIFRELPGDIHVLFLPVNGVGNNMNMTDACAFAERTGAAHTIPVHYGMFDAIDIRTFTAPNKTVLTVYQEVTL